jgi:hypothetical protein
MVNYPLLFVERLTEHDLGVLALADDTLVDTADLRRLLAREPNRLESYLGDPRVYERVFEDKEMIPGLSPILVFALLVHRAMRDLESVSYVSEWTGAGERLPVFDVESLRVFIEDIVRRHLIIEFLSSFTRVTSGSVWVRTRRGYRKRRYSELDPLALAEMVESMPAERRASGYRRLGDVALFLTGVFPDYTARHPLSAVGRARLADFTGVSEREDLGLEYVRFLEVVGSHWYGRAASSSRLHPGREPLADMAANFTLARRFLNYLADTHLHQLDTGLMNPVS